MAFFSFQWCVLFVPWVPLHVTIVIVLCFLLWAYVHLTLRYLAWRHCETREAKTFLQDRYCFSFSFSLSLSLSLSVIFTVINYHCHYHYCSQSLALSLSLMLSFSLSLSFIVPYIVICPCLYLCSFICCIVTHWIRYEYILLE